MAASRLSPVPTRPEAPSEPATGPRAGARALWPGAAIALTALAYWFVPGAYFWADDFLNLYEIANRGGAEFVLRMHGGHLLLTRNALFLLSAHTFGTNPAGYFWLALLTHLLNAFLVFLVIRNVTGSPRVACFGAALWGTLPSDEAALTWYSAYGHVLAGTFLLAVLSGLTRAARSGGAARTAPLLWAALLLGAATSFGVGLGVALAMPVVAWLLLAPSPTRTRTVVAFALVAAAVPFLYVGTQRLYVSRYGGPLPFPILIAGLAYWTQHLRLLADLLAVATAYVIAGPFNLAAGYPGPVADGAVALYALVVVGGLAFASGARRRQLAALLVFAVAAYGIIAAGRGMFRTPANGAWMAITPRFHYVGTVPLAVALCLALATLAQRFGLGPRLATSALLAWIAVSVLVSARGTIVTRRSPGLVARTETARALADIRAAIDAAPPGDAVYLDNRPFRGVGPMLVRAPQLFPGWAGLFTIFFPANVVDGRRVFFVDPNPEVIAAAEKGRRTASLLVGARPMP
jgi:hypothetical protein